MTSNPLAFQISVNEIFFRFYLCTLHLLSIPVNIHMLELGCKYAIHVHTVRVPFVILFTYSTYVRFILYGVYGQDTLKVHKHEIFLKLFLQKPKPYGPKGL
jgi:hypothetical protein